MYEPSQEIIDAYADVLVNFGLGEGKGIKKGDVVAIHVPEFASRLALSIYRAVVEAGGNPVTLLGLTGAGKIMYEQGSDDQLSFFPRNFYKGLFDDIDHFLQVYGSKEVGALKNIPAKRITAREKAYRPVYDWREEKINAGKLSRTLAYYPSESMAKEVGITLEEFWEEIIRSCFLRDENPIQKWKDLQKEIHEIRDRLTALRIQTLHVKSKDTDFTIGIGSDRKWLGLRGANVPSFEIFISPNNKIADGKISFSEPAYQLGKKIVGAWLEFKDGKVIDLGAEEEEDLLREIVESDGGNRIGEFSLTDKRHSRITKYLGSTLFVENMGGDFGNMHIALGSSYKDAYDGESAGFTQEDWDCVGMNDGDVHVDIITRDDRTVTATLEDGSTKVIYQDGMFTV